jgi:hypothetical protein
MAILQRVRRTRWLAGSAAGTAAALLVAGVAVWGEVNDGARVTLTFHFWSGTRVTYYVTESGGSVTGTTS